MLFLCLSGKIEKEKRELAKQYGMVRTEVAGGEIAEEMEKERRMFQLHMCEVRQADGEDSSQEGGPEPVFLSA